MRSSKNSTSFRSAVDRWFFRVAYGAAAMSAAIVLLVMAFLLAEAWPALRRIAWTRFATDSGWHPLSDQYNMLPMAAATLLTSAGAMAIASPLGVGSAVFSRYYAPPWIARWHRRLIRLLAGIPSVVFGLWGLVVLAPLLARLGGSGQSLLAAIVILALMILPTIALTADAALGVVPAEQLRAAAALGLDRWGIIRRIAVPGARRGIGAGHLLAAARAVGETMAVLMVAGNVVRPPNSLLAPVRTLTANIALELGYATQDHRSVLFVSGLLLMTAVGFAVAAAERFAGGRRDATG